MAERADTPPSDGTDTQSITVVFLRHDAEILLIRYRGPLAAFEDQWAGVVTPADPSADLPENAIPVRAGDPFAIRARGTKLTVRPALFDCPSRNVGRPDGAMESEWVPATEIHRKETVPGLWRAYDRVRPTAATLAADTEHGSGYISIRAMEVVRDAAGALWAEGVGTEAAWAELTDVAEDVLAARPSMAALRTRIDRIASRAAGDRTAATVASIATEEIDAALEADRRAAGAAGAILDGTTVLTLSRSGTVLPVLKDAPERVIVAESRPDREGIGVAERLTEAGVDVSVCVDAAIAHVLATEPVDAVVLGADTVLGDGTLINKVGSRGAAITACEAGIPVYVVTARDKISPDRTPTLESGPAEAVYAGDRAIDVHAPTFDATPPAYVTGILTEDGRLEPAEVAEVADTHAALAGWRRGPSESGS
ncbi:initiation factor 2B [Natronomonas sp. LN261]|uniref:initiation factor 2B n=1 Tax=Natronomonas sp. LN261 TaxID=2750669 RepID=UPI0015EFCF38|nr:initiation factor 2B [Natronomonas sp. LN261]